MAPVADSTASLEIKDPDVDPEPLWLALLSTFYSNYLISVRIFSEVKMQEKQLEQ